MSSSPAILSRASTTDQLPWLRPELPCMFVSGSCPFSCWSGKERWKSWEKPAPSHSPSHHQQSPQSRLFSHPCMTNTTTGTWSAWEFFQPVFRATFLQGGSYDMFPIFFLSVKSWLAPSVQRDGPQIWHQWKITLLESFIYLEFPSKQATLMTGAVHAFLHFL